MIYIHTESVSDIDRQIQRVDIRHQEDEKSQCNIGTQAAPSR